VQQILRVTWQVAPLQCPLIRRHCSRCKTAMPFACSMKFRTNAQKKRLDVWLIYRCAGCAATWNLPIHERTAIGHIAPEEFQAIARNDPALAARYAFDRERLARHGDHVEEGVGVTVKWLSISEPSSQPSNVEISIRLALPSRMRLDRLLAQQLGMGRGQLHALREIGLLAILPHARNGLGSPIIDGQRILLTLGQDATSLHLMAAIRSRTMS
jgi:hypothetical protein